MELSLFPALAISGLGFVLGAVLGAVLRGTRVKKETLRLQQELKRLSEERAAADDDVDKRPQRWSGTEIAAILGALGSLFGVLGAIYNGSQLNTIKQQASAVKQLDAEVQASKAFADRVESLLRFKLERWEILPSSIAQPSRTGPAAIERLDEKNVTAEDCGSRRLDLRYAGSFPAILICNSREPGAVTIKLGGPTRIMLLPQNR